jgi:hypothetical protein
MNHDTNRISQLSGAQHATDETPITLSQNVVARLRALANEIAQIEDICRRNADRLKGGELAPGSTGSKQGPAAVPNGTLAELDECVDLLSSLLQALAVQVDRFNNA